MLRSVRNGEASGLRPPASTSGIVAGSGQLRELMFQQVDLCEVAARVVIAASLAGFESKPAARVLVAGAASA